ncbi:MAG: GNAT family N-acetyltransferase, partial [Alphaproteobacteria bacterium]
MTMSFTHDLAVELANQISDADLADLCEATDAAIIEGGGFGWLEPQGREALARHFRRTLVVPVREVFIARLYGPWVGSALFVRGPRKTDA